MLDIQEYIVLLGYRNQRNKVELANYICAWTKVENYEQVET